MTVTPSFLTYVLDQFGSIGQVTARRMFGGVGLYYADLFIGAVDDDTVYLRVDDATRPEYEKLGMVPLRPVKSKPELVIHSYYQLPADVLDDPEQLRSWAQRAIAAAAAPKRKRAPRARSSRVKADGTSASSDAQTGTEKRTRSPKKTPKPRSS